MTRKFQDTWLSESLYEMLLQFYPEDVREKSEALLTENVIQEVYVEPGRISSRVTIEKRMSHRIVIQVPEVSREDFDKIITILSKDERCLIGLYNNKLTDVCFDHEIVKQVLLFNLEHSKAVIEDEQVSISDERILAVFEKCIHYLIENSLAYITLRGRGTEQFIHDVREARLVHLLERNTSSRSDLPHVHMPMLTVTAEDYYKGGNIQGMNVVVRADELPAALLKRLDHLPSHGGLEFVDKNLEMAYERVTRLAQSLARFLS